MPISLERRNQLERDLPPAEETRKQVLTYISRADMTRNEFAKAINYSSAAMRAFMENTYTTTSRVGRTDLLIREAAELYMVANSLEKKQLTTRLYETENVKEMRHWFNFCHDNRALAYVYGPPGSQKTFVFEHLIQEFNAREASLPGSRSRAFYVRASVNSTPRDMAAKMCVAAGAPTYFSMQKCMSSLRYELRGTQSVFVLDEAQLCGINALEAVRELHDVDPKIGCLLAGSHALRQFFEAREAELEQWNSRLEAGIELGGVSDEAARAILGVECPGMSAEEMAEIVEASRAPDIYSRKRGHTYLNMRRLFKNIAAINRLSAEAEGAAK